MTRDPEAVTFRSGGKVAKFGFAVTNRRKNSQSGEWEDEPMFIDCEVFNRGEFGKLADLVMTYCQKGSQICIEGRLHLDQWEDKNGGGKRSKHKVIVETVQLLDPKPQDGSGTPASRQPAAAAAGRPAARTRTEDLPYDEEATPAAGDEDSIPF